MLGRIGGRQARGGRRLKGRESSSGCKECKEIFWSLGRRIKATNWLPYILLENRETISVIWRAITNRSVFLILDSRVSHTGLRCFSYLSLSPMCFAGTLYVFCRYCICVFWIVEKQYVFCVYCVSCFYNRLSRTGLDLHTFPHGYQQFDFRIRNALQVLDL